MNLPKPKQGYKVVIGRFKIPHEIPEPWEWTTIGNECELTSGSTPSRSHPEFFTGNILWVNSCWNKRAMCCSRQGIYYKPIMYGILSQ